MAEKFLQSWGTFTEGAKTEFGLLSNLTSR
jgi:hypothetical protein